MVKLNDLMTVKYKAGGRSVEGGLDCYGLVKVIYSRLGKTLPEFDGQATTDYKNINNLAMKAKNRFIRLNFPEPFCIVAIMRVRPYVSHIGVMLEDNVHFIHILEDNGVTVSSIQDIKWADRIEGYYRWQG